jgi:SAM-dependent MidA family methyltransferase
MTKYQHQAITIPAELIAAGIEEETIIRQQIHQLIQQIPMEDLYKIVRVEKETIRQPYWQSDEERITVSIIL